MQIGIADGRGGAGGVHIALPVRTGDHPALAVHPGPGEQGVRRGGIHLRQEQGGGPAAHGVAGRITAFAAQGSFFAGKHGLVENFKGTAAVIECLRGHAHLVRCGKGARHDLPDGRGGFFRDGEAEGSGKLGEQGLVTPDGIPLRDIRPEGILALGLPPLIAHDVVSEPIGKGIRRGGDALDQVGKLLRRIVFLLCRSGHAGKKQSKDGNERFHSCHRSSILFWSYHTKIRFFHYLCENHMDKTS